MKVLIYLKLVVIASLALAGCSNQGFQEVIRTLEFEEGETGCFRAQGNVDAGSGWFARGQVNVILVKKTSADAPNC